MKTRSGPFKPAFARLLLILALVTASIAQAKDGEALFRLHLEVSKDGTDKSAPVSVLRSNPVQVNVEKQAFLNERHLTNAVMFKAVGGFAIELQFGTTGRKLLEQYSTNHRGRHVAIFCQWGDPKKPTTRWLAAPVFTHSITDGRLRFTPDASEEEIEAMVKGVDYLIRKERRKSPLQSIIEDR